MNRTICLFILLDGIGESVYCQRKILLPTLNYTGDIIGNFSGGDKRSVQYMGLIDAGIEVSTDSAGWWKGGWLNIELISTHGKGITTAVLHDNQGICGIEAGNHPLLMWELWYHQQFGRLGIRGGFQNINSDFMNQPFIGSFSGSSYSVFPTLALNYSLPNYPVGALGLSISYKLDKNWYVITSLFNGKASAVGSKNRHGLKWRISPRKDGILSITEVKYASDTDRFPTHTLGLGFVYHDKEFTSVRDTLKSYKNNYTFYAFGERELYRDAYRSAGAFVQGSYAIRNRNSAYAYSGVGLALNGFFSRNHTDNAGIGLSQLYYRSFENDQLKNRIESALEVFVKYRMNKYLSLKPTFFTIFSSGKPTVTAAMIEFGIDIF